MTDIATEARVRWLEEQVAELTEQLGIARMHGRLLAEEVKAWRDGDVWHDLIGYMQEDTSSHAPEVEKAMAQTNAANALEPTP